jgi:beta-glucosidase
MMRAVLSLVSVGGWMLGGSQRAWGEDVPPYKNTALPFEQRVADLVSRMSIAEKGEQLMVQAPPVERLGISPFNWWTEGLHGLARGGGPGRGGRGGGGGGRGGNFNGAFDGGATGGSTIFPDAIAMGATFDPALVHDVASAIADEARARFVPGGRGRGISLWCPTLNLARDPRWGRTEETFGEDPFLAGRLGVAYVEGLQGDDPKYVKTVATPKHFAGYNVETSRTSQDAKISERTLREYYLAPFEAAVVEGKALSIMSAFNSINGVPCTGNAMLLTDILRNDWGFQGAVVCDSRAMTLMERAHQYAGTPRPEDTLPVAINAGLDIINDVVPPGTSIQEMVNSGRIKPETLDRAVSRNLYVRFRLGLFDPPAMVPFTRIPASVVGSEEHIALALRTACESMVLLKNQPAPRGRGLEKLLPLDLRKVDSIAVIGPHVDDRQYGSYGYGSPAGSAPTFLEALRATVGDRVIIRTADHEDAIEAARKSDVVIIVSGLSTQMERASIDRRSLDLPLDQLNLFQQVFKANPATILVLEGGSSIGLEWASANIPAIVMSWYSGEQGGVAMARTLLGENDPAGRLPLTFYRSSDDLPPMDDYEISRAARVEPGGAARSVPPAGAWGTGGAGGEGGATEAERGSHGRTYMYFDKPVTYAFGHGLSYTSFAYSGLHLAEGTLPGEAATVTVDVRNDGPRDGEEVVQVYAAKPDSGVMRPLRQLVAFQRIAIPRGATRTVRLSVSVRVLSIWDLENHAFALEPGVYELGVGAGSDDVRARGSIVLK